MLVSLRKMFVLIILALTLLAGLIGWSARMVTMPMMQHHSGVHTTHTLAWYCPPPPRFC
ncbi:MAG TPA: hypothetical protein VFA41_16365 [Ktedonobacteraceae bacterium]|jgi:hypothetical protein|nr:hypothetical protein [Ktedonobacteraceae bacterium]